MKHRRVPAGACALPCHNALAQPLWYATPWCASAVAALRWLRVTHLLRLARAKTQRFISPGVAF